MNATVRPVPAGVAEGAEADGPPAELVTEPVSSELEIVRIGSAPAPAGASRGMNAKATNATAARATTTSSVSWGQRRALWLRVFISM
ncbi:Predicted 5' DNA nuclease, flap endonuclease-1-like, helix-3-turn-helix (H3TH) domain (fragment) [Pseudoclavibacter sp. 8L]